MRNILSNIKSFCVLAVLAATSFCGTGVSAAEAGADPERTYYIVYHDQNGSVISREVYTENYSIDVNKPSFYTGNVHNANTGWNTQADLEGTTYKTGNIIPSLSAELHLYAVVKSGFFVRFDSREGTPIKYQFVTEGNKASRPEPPEKPGYSFSQWNIQGTSTEYTFTENVTSNIILEAVWTPKTVSYTVRVWKEKATHPKRTSAQDAYSNRQDDYDFALAFTKTGTAGGNTMSFTTTGTNRDINRSDVQAAIKTTTLAANHQIFFFDDNFDSYAASMTNIDIAEANSKGIAGDGSSVINVYMRRMAASLVFVADKSLFSGGGARNQTIDLGVTIRYEEHSPDALMNSGKWDTYNSMIQRLGVSDAFNADTNVNGINKQSQVYGPNGGDCYWSAFSPNKATFVAEVLFESFDGIMDYELFVDNSEIVVTVYKTTVSNKKYVRETLIETLESARNNREQYNGWRSANPSNFEKNPTAFPDYVEYNTGESASALFFTEDKGVQTYFSRIVNTNTGLERSGSRTQELYSTYYPEPFHLQYFYLRRKYQLTFDTGIYSGSINNLTVPYDDDLIYYKDRIKDSETQTGFVKDVTTYTDPVTNFTWVFKGWFDNPAFTGSEIDFNTTAMKMPSSNLNLYAKWETHLLTATFNGNGGTIGGMSTLEETFEPGKVPIKPENPVPPEGLEFLCWEIDRVVYDFSDQLYQDVEIVARYYNDSKYNLTYNVGDGSGSAPEDSYDYVYGANAEVLEPGSALIPPKRGRTFDHWEDADGNEFLAGAELIMKRNEQLTAIFVDGGAKIVINRSGLKANESAVYNIYKDGSSTPLMTVSLTAASGDALASRTIISLDAGVYTVTEQGWSWAYQRGDTEVTPAEAMKSEGKGTASGTLELGKTLTFTFTGDPIPTVTTKHAEHVIPNEF